MSVCESVRRHQIWVKNIAPQWKKSEAPTVNQCLKGLSRCLAMEKLTLLTKNPKQTVQIKQRHFMLYLERKLRNHSVLFHKEMKLMHNKLMNNFVFLFALVFMVCVGVCVCVHMHLDMQSYCGDSAQGQS